MYLPITTAVLLLLTAALLLLRIFWARVPSMARFFLIRAAVALILLEALLTVTHWEINSDHLNTLLKWLAVASYELLVLIFSTLPPRWLTIICACILMVPAFSASVVMPLQHIFDPHDNPLHPIGSDFFSQNVPWAGDSSANSGSELKIFYRPHFAPFLRRNSLTFPFNDQECNARASFAILQPDRKHVLARCPQWPSRGSGTDDRLFPLH